MISRRNKNKYFNVAIVVLVIILLIILQRPVRSFFYSSTDNVQSNMWERGLWFGCSGLKKDNQALKNDNEELLSKLVDLDQLKLENEEFRNALDLEINEDFNVIEGRVLSKVNDKEVVVINKGSVHEVIEGMTVIDFEKVLIGRITKVFKETSQLTLITDPDIKFGVNILNTDIRGMVKGDKNNLVLDLVPNDKELNIDDVVYSSFNQDVFPPNLLIGKVAKAKRSDLESFYKATVLPFFDEYSLNHILIIK
jgi:rod shape-determining protein MreC